MDRLERATIVGAASTGSLQVSSSLIGETVKVKTSRTLDFVYTVGRLLNNQFCFLAAWRTDIGMV